jgi:hypothetical protein
MKIKRDESNFWHTMRKIFRRKASRHDPLLVFNMLDFNFTDGWRRTFSKSEYGRYYA